MPESAPRQMTREVERNGKRAIELGELLCRKTSDVVRQRGLGQAHELVAVNRTVVLETFVNAYWHLR